MSTITKEWLESQISAIKVVGITDSNTLQAFEIALASLEAEAVGYMNRFTGRVFTLEEQPGADTDVNVYVPVYAAPPAPVSVPAAMEMDDDFDSAFEHGKAVGWNAYRAAMLQGADGTLTNEGTIPVTQFNPVVDLYGLTSPTGGETSFTFDAVEARDFIDGGWSCQEYVELGRFQEAMLQNGNSPAQSDCCPEQNYIAPAQDGDYPVIPDGWIPVSERMPGSQEWVIVFAKWDNQQVLCWDDVANRWTDFEDQSYYADMFTHWMPLPAAPQQEDIIC